MAQSNGPVSPDVKAMLGVVTIDQVLRLREVAHQAGLKRLEDACGDEIRRRSSPIAANRRDGVARWTTLRRIP